MKINNVLKRFGIYIMQVAVLKVDEDDDGEDIE